MIEPAAGVDAGHSDLADEIVAFCRRAHRQVQGARSRSTSCPSCRATRTASSTSGSSATRTGWAENGPFDLFDFGPVRSALRAGVNLPLARLGARGQLALLAQGITESGMKIGLNLPVMAPGSTGSCSTPGAAGIDEGPFSSLAVGERINFPNPEITVTLSAAAAWTARVPLFYNVLVLPTHAGARAAKQIATLDVALERPRRARRRRRRARGRLRARSARPGRAGSKRLERQVAELRRLWGGGRASGASDPIEPQPVQPGGPPILHGRALPARHHRARRISPTASSASRSRSRVTSSTTPSTARAPPGRRQDDPSRRAS